MMFIISIFFSINYSYSLNTNIVTKKLIKYEKNIRSLVLYSYDPFNPITKFIRIELFNNGINVLEDLNDTLKIKNTYMRLSIIDISETYITTSVFPDGTEAGYQLILHVYMQLIMPNKKIYCPLNIQVHRSFIKNPTNILFNDVQENDMRNSMYQEISKKLIIYINEQK